MGKHIEDIHALPLLLLHPCRPEAALMSCLAGRGLGSTSKITQPSSPERGQAGLEHSGKFFHLGLFHVDASVFWYFHWR